MAFALFVNIAGMLMPMAGTPRASLSVRLAAVPAPTVSMVVRRDSEHEKVAVMPTQLAEWGCDEDMWMELRASGRKSLKRLAKKGDLKGNAREVRAPVPLTRSIQVHPCRSMAAKLDHTHADAAHALAGDRLPPLSGRAGRCCAGTDWRANRGGPGRLGGSGAGGQGVGGRGRNCGGSFGRGGAPGTVGSG